METFLLSLKAKTWTVLGSLRTKLGDIVLIGTSFRKLKLFFVDDKTTECKQELNMDAERLRRAVESRIALRNSCHLRVKVFNDIVHNSEQSLFPQSTVCLQPCKTGYNLFTYVIVFMLLSCFLKTTPSLSLCFLHIKVQRLCHWWVRLFWILCCQTGPGCWPSGWYCGLTQSVSAPWPHVGFLYEGIFISCCVCPWWTSWDRICTHHIPAFGTWSWKIDGCIIWI